MPFDAASIHELLDEAAELFHRARGVYASDRAEQFDSHLTVVKDAVDWTASRIATQEPTAPPPTTTEGA